MKKLAKDVRVGDTLVIQDTLQVVVAIRPVEGAALEILTVQFVSWPCNTLERVIAPNTGAEFEVITGDLTPNQQQAGELEALVRAGLNSVSSEVWRKRAHAVLDKIDPPTPPTVDELLEALQMMTEPPDARYPERFNKARALIERGRRAGLIK